MEQILKAVLDELESATNTHGPFHSAHEGFAILLEEVDELWEEVKFGTPERAREECIQVAAMALRFLKDIK